MATSTISMGAEHGWKIVSTNNGNAGVTIPSDWKELHITSTFGLNGNYVFINIVLREQFDNKAVANFNLLNGCCLNSANDYHGMTLNITSTSVKILSWKYNNTECSSQSPLSVYYR